MKARVTMRDVAREAGVSTMTVSRALKSNGFVNSRTRALVQEAADRLGYVYDTTAQAFRAQRSGVLAITMPSLNNANFAETHRALTDALAASEMQILLGVTNYRLEEEERLVRQLLARRPEAIVLTGGRHTAPTRSLIGALEIPAVEIWDLPSDPIGHVVGFSNVEAMGLLVDHLVATGRRRLAFLGASAETDHRGSERRRGVEVAARRLGLPDVVFLDAGPAPVSMREGARTVQENRDKISEIDALTCVSDPVAFGALCACRSLAIDVPGTLAITGFGAFEISQVNVPAITTVDVGAGRIGELAGQLLDDLMSSRSADRAQQRIETAVQLLPGGTT